MVDPLRPTTVPVEALVRSKSVSKSQVGEPRPHDINAGSLASQVAQPAKLESFEKKLKSRLSTIDPHDRKQLRQAFIEVSLLNEFGEQLSIDPGFAMLIDKIDIVISADSHMEDGLHKKLSTLFMEKTGPRA